MRTNSRRLNEAFTLLELAVVLGVLGVLACMLAPALGSARPNTQAAQCMNNMRQLAAVFKMNADDNGDVLLSAADELTGRSYWLSSGTLQPYTNGTSVNLRCPADQSTASYPPRCISMNSAFGKGEWLGGSLGVTEPWRVYAKGAEIMAPAKTFVFADEHPNSLNDGALCVACTGNETTAPPALSQIIDWPASYHDGAGSFCFADGRAEIHKWVGSKIKAQVGISLLSSVSAGDSWPDMHWLAENTTVRK